MSNTPGKGNRAGVTEPFRKQSLNVEWAGQKPLFADCLQIMTYRSVNSFRFSKIDLGNELIGLKFNDLRGGSGENRRLERILMKL